MSGWVLVTGASQRIGRAIALDLAASGWDVIVHYNLGEKEATETARLIEMKNRRVCLASLDLADRPLTEKLLPALEEELGPITALVNNASQFSPDAEDPSDRQARINFEAPCVLTEALAASAKNKVGPVRSVVNILDADPTAPDFAFYNRSKTNLADATVDMARRLTPHCRVNGVALGPILRNDRQTEAHFAVLLKRTQRDTAPALSEVTHAIRFLLETVSINGAILPVDNGLHLSSGKRPVHSVHGTKNAQKRKY